MLVLTRRPGESVIIAGDIKITVVSVGPGRVKLGIEAPPHVRIDRQEIHEKIEQASDVLAAVGSTAAGGTHNTLITNGADTALIIDGEPKPAEAPKPAVPPLGKLSRFRKPRIG